MDHRKQLPPLVLAISDNDTVAVEKLLQQGNKLSAAELKDAFFYKHHENGWRETKAKPKLDPKILHLLEINSALPEVLSFSTLKLILFLNGDHEIISLDEKINPPDLNANGVPDLPSPMELAVRDYNVKAVRFLLSEGAKQRPLQILYGEVHHYFFMGCDLLNIEKEKNRLLKDFAFVKEWRHHKNQSALAELLIADSSPELFKLVEDDLKTKEPRLCFLPLFGEAAINNRYDLFNNKFFVYLFNTYPEVADQALKVAAIFGNSEFIEAAFALDKLDFHTVNALLSIAAAMKNDPLLETIMRALKKQGMSLASIFYQVNQEDNFGSERDALFWAIRKNNPSAVKFLLDNDIPCNGYRDGWADESYLHLATRIGDLSIIHELLAHGAQVDFKTARGNTPLLNLVRHGSNDKELAIAHLLVKTYGADPYIKDENGKSALDYIENPLSKAEFIQDYENFRSKAKPAEIPPSRQSHCVRFYKAVSSLIVGEEHAHQKIPYSPLLP